MHTLIRRARVCSSSTRRASQPASFAACTANAVSQKRTYETQQTPDCTASSGTHVQRQDGLQQQSQHQQGMPWYNHKHPEDLRDILKLPPFRFQTLIQQEPSILDYQADTLAATLRALNEALHINHVTLVRVLEQRPSIMCRPHEPVLVLNQLAQLLGRSQEQTAFLLSPYPQLLALQPHQLAERVQELCTIMHWPYQDTQQPAGALAAAAAGAPAFLQLLSTPLQRTSQQLTALSAALDTSQEHCASMVQHRTVLLDMSPAVVRSRLFVLADNAGVSCKELVEQLDQEQTKCLAGLLLLSPSRLQQQVNALAALVQSADSSCRQNQLGSEANTQAAAAHNKHFTRKLVHLLLRLGGPTAVAQAAVTMVALRGIVRKHKPWQQELDSAASDAELAVLLTAGSQSLAQARYLQRVGLASSMSLNEVLTCPTADFNKMFGPDYNTWLTGG